MEREEFLTKFQELSVEYRNLKKRLDETDKKDQSLRLEIMQQMQDNVRRKNALRKHFTIEEN
jgi:tetrahydromethanopterin S-methyltransferase subunit G